MLNQKFKCYIFKLNNFDTGFRIFITNNRSDFLKASILITTLFQEGIESISFSQTIQFFTLVLIHVPLQTPFHLISVIRFMKVGLSAIRAFAISQTKTFEMLVNLSLTWYLQINWITY